MSEIDPVYAEIAERTRASGREFKNYGLLSWQSGIVVVACPECGPVPEPPGGWPRVWSVLCQEAMHHTARTAHPVAVRLQLSALYGTETEHDAAPGDGT